jgi:hypothetical protein
MSTSGIITSTGSDNISHERAQAHGPSKSKPSRNDPIGASPSGGTMASHGTTWQTAVPDDTYLRRSVTQNSNTAVTTCWVIGLRADALHG